MNQLINTLPIYARDYLEQLIRKGRQESTVKRYFYDLNDFFAWMKVKKNADTYDMFQSLTIEDYLSYFHFLSEQRKYSPKTLKRIMTVLKQFIRFEMMKGNLSSNPVDQLHLEFDDEAPFSETDFMTEEEAEKLVQTLASLDDLTENQLKYRYLLIDRNKAIFTLLYHYGLTLQELVSITMKQVALTSGRINVHSETSVSRPIYLNRSDQTLLFSYYETIPESVRPRLYTNDPLFVAFDFQRGTFRWDYKLESPKPLTEIAVQKMIRLEVARANLRKGISAQHMRRTCILRLLKQEENVEKVQKQFGFKTPLSLNRYINYLEKNIRNPE
ncbi:tyrosine-type recombinase/integrase [Fictibacillus gelatini]|uniref:tyrosine-type recombinase/integrase n=1 Tax=Fictibacillus gelatini TaxID=225985 RepID=UPI0004108667|nr:tyrosine-type recombinase/integrase [Fictibacillus gelatini]